MKPLKSFAKLIILFTCFFAAPAKAQVITGAERVADYLPLIQGKNVALVVNQTSIIGKKHLVDSLLLLKVKVKKIFAPEHGFRGNAEAGENISTYTDKKTGLNVVSLYGKYKKPSSADLADVDVIIFDIQDVGVRFYTYISTLTYVMEACAENKKKLIVLDRPNPLGFYVDGPVLDTAFRSFVGMHKVPIVYGMTIGEYAEMVNGEGWLKDSIRCDLKVIQLTGYGHQTLYELPVPPSPNLQTMEAIYLYPALCLFEGTTISVGRGTDKPFQIIGSPYFSEGNFSFTPKSIKGKAENPMYKGIKCYGFDLTKFAFDFVRYSKELYMFWLIGCYDKTPDKSTFFTPYFDQLAGTDKLRKQIESGTKLDEIRASWKPELASFKVIRKKYLIYGE